MRSHLCGDISESLVGQTVQLCGWVDKQRDLGGLSFISLRDYSGIMQVVVEPDNRDLFAAATELRNEYCVQIAGTVRARPESQWNRQMRTGKVELVAEKIVLLNRSAPLPLLMTDEDGEETRLRYRYLDMRRPRMQHNLRLRARLYQAIRTYLDADGFCELETPILTKATPEGARDYLVPSRVSRGQFYALPQSPQLFKQLFMMAGMDRYYQIARCFRDEDLRADRQPEFTQLDIEMSFVQEADVQIAAEQLIRTVFKQVLNVELPDPFPRMTYAEAMTRFGSDKPDLRIPLELKTVCAQVRDLEFKVFAGPASDPASRVVALQVPGGASLSRKQIDGYAALAAKYGAKGLAWLKVNTAAQGLQGVQSPIAKFLTEEALSGILTVTGAQDGDLIFFGADLKPVVNQYMGAVRLQVAEDFSLVSEEWQPLWVTDFPMFEWDEETQRYYSMHHPFTAPSEDDPLKLAEDPAQSLSKGYDMVLNGAEIGGGSIRIHQPDMQQTVFNLLSIDETEAKTKFGFLLEALKYGCPPHGGIAFGLDRIVALMAKEDSIRDVIAYPKTTTAQCPLTEAPSQIEPEILSELGIAVSKPADS